MADVVRAALVQTSWTGDKESMIKAHEEYARQAAAQGAKIICFQELFYGPYFCQVQDNAFYSYAESITVLRVVVSSQIRASSWSLVDSVSAFSNVSSGRMRSPRSVSSKPSSGRGVTKISASGSLRTRALK